MFDDPGKKLRQLEDDLRELEEPEESFSAEEFEEDMPEFDEGAAVLAREERHPGLKTLVLLLILAGAAAWAGWKLGWL